MTEGLAAGTADTLLSSWSHVPRAIVEAGLWCAVEICTDVPAQRWEPRLLLCLGDDIAVLAEIADWIVDVPMWDARVAGYTRDDPCRADHAPTALVHVAV